MAKRIYKITIFVVGLVAVGIIAQPAEAKEFTCRIRLQPGVEMEAGPVKLGNVAGIDAEEDEIKSRLNNLIISRLSADSVPISVGSFEISRALTLAGINLAGVDIYGASSCRLVVIGGPVAPDSAEKVENTAKEEVETAPLENQNQDTLADELVRMVTLALDRPRERLRFTWNSPDKSLLQQPFAAERFEIKPASPLTLGRVRFRIIEKNNPDNKTDNLKEQGSSAPERIVHVWGEVEYLCPSVVASRILQPGEVIAPADVKLMPRWVNNFAEVGFSDIDSVVGQEASRGISASMVIEPSMVRKLQLVKRNELITVSATMGRIQASLQGKALSDGGLGDIISVRNESSSRIIRCRVDGAGLVTAILDNKNEVTNDDSASSPEKEAASVNDLVMRSP